VINRAHTSVAIKRNLVRSNPAGKPQPCQGGNSSCVLIEAAWTYRYSARVSQVLQDRVKGLPWAVRTIAWKAQCDYVLGTVGRRRGRSLKGSNFSA